MSTMRRRKQQHENDGEKPSEDTQQDSAPKEKHRTPETDDDDTHTRSARSKVLPIVLYLCRLSGCILFAYGMYLGQTELCTHEECDMTYSMRQFLELDMKGSRSASLRHYRLFKFIDQRDPRHSPFRRHEQPLQGKEWCLDPTQTTAVLYVPGHGGSYEQSRSLGAHGLQLTQRQNAGQPRRVLHALQNNLLTGNATDLDSFIFDVYALDFGEEGAGLHGRLVEQQSSMVADAVEFLIETCQLPFITIVAHSIGGYATRLALADYPELLSSVRNVITLATPHAYPILAIEPSLHRVFARLDQQQNTQLALVSIGGAWRDEMIPPHSCQTPNALNLGTVDIMSSGRKKAPLLGMDHRAVVWCHNLLSRVREIIFTLNRSDENDAPARLREVAQRLDIPSDYNYLDSVKRTRMAYTESFGWWRSILAENGLLYTIEHLVGLYALSSSLYFLLGLSSRSSVAVVCLAPLFLGQTLQSDSFSWGSLYILSLVADTVFILLLYIYSAWILLILPLFSSGLFYVTLIQQIPAPVLGFCTAVLPIAILPLLRGQLTQGSTKFSLSDVARLACIVVALACLSSPGAAYQELGILECSNNAIVFFRLKREALLCHRKLTGWRLAQ
eukprot:scaffold2500_cov176-Amphora_coffeaeformis.AAC.1